MVLVLLFVFIIVASIKFSAITYEEVCVESSSDAINVVDEWNSIVGKICEDYEDNASCLCHPDDVNLCHIKILFFPANTTSKCQPLDQGKSQNSNFRNPKKFQSSL